MPRRSLIKRQVAAAALAISASHLCFANIDAPIQLDFPSQALSQTIIQLGKTCEISIIVPSHLLKGLKAPTLDGEYTPREALEKILKSSPLTFKEINRRVVVIVPHHKKAQSDGGDEFRLEELVIVGQQVTGSFLKRTDLQGSSPVDIISKHEIDISGSQNVGEFLKFVPAVSGNSTSTAISNGGDGTATVTLRGLPANNTLVLLNGKRITFDGLDGNSIDLNSLPSAVVERIEILKDGASAIYGTDAIAGVVNVILKRDYDGLQFEQYFGSTTKKDVETRSSHLLWGRSNPRSGVLVSAQHFEQNGLFSRQRGISANVDGTNQGGIDKRSTATPNSRINIGENNVVTLIDDQPGTSIDDYREVNDDDRFNYFAQTSTISPSSRTSIFFSGHNQLNDDVTLSVDGGYTKTRATITLASTPIFTSFVISPITVAADNIYNPFGEPISDIRRRVIELAPREQENRTESKRLSVTLDGFLENANWEVNANWSRTEATQTSQNLLRESRVSRALGPSNNCLGAEIDGCTPLNLFGPSGSITPEQLSYIRSSSIVDGHTQLAGINGNISTSLMNTPAGPTLIALGVDLRHEEVDSKPLDGGVDNLGGTTRGDTLGKRRIYETFFESQIPLIKNLPGAHSLDAEIAVRHSYYNDFGSNTSPKVGLRYRPIPDLLLRSTYSEGFRAPNLGELYTGEANTQLPLNDPCANIDNVGVLPGCVVQSDPSRIQYLTTVAGAPDLKPETSESYTVGIVWTPNFLPDLHVSVDKFVIDQTNIVSANAQLILDRNVEFGQFSELVNRDSNGEITRLVSPFINIGKREIAGVDTTIRYSYETETAGKIALSLNASYLDKYTYQLDLSAPPEKLHSRFADAANEGSGALPRRKANAGIFWQLGKAEWTYSVNYISSVTETIPRSEGQQRKLKHWITHDTQVSYSFGKSNAIKVSLGADNILDQAPPFAASAFNDNYDARTYDIKGAFWYGRASYKF